jgi:branched-chain amino acid transport system permease protein
MKVWGLTPEVGLLLGTLSGALLGLIVGFFAIRRQGIYSTMITLALAQMLFFVCLQAPFHRWRRRSAGRATRQAVRPD